MVTFFSKAGRLPDHAYSPLERDSTFASPATSGDHQGGVSQIQVIRYTDSPVGPYDELIICPGYFSYETERAGRRGPKKSLRASRVYVSQKHTCWNGRTNWNIPKHLARFEFDGLDGGATRVRVFPHDTAGDSSEARPSNVPLFQATFQPIRWAFGFPFSTAWLRHVGHDPSFVQPPLPAGEGSQGELPGTGRWCKVATSQSTRCARLTWADLSQRREQGAVASSVAHDNFWPGLGRWHLALKLEDAEVDVAEGTYWDVPSSML